MYNNVTNYNTYLKISEINEDEFVMIMQNSKRTQVLQW